MRGKSDISGMHRLLIPLRRRNLRRREFLSFRGGTTRSDAHGAAVQAAWTRHPKHTAVWEMCQLTTEQTITISHEKAKMESWVPEGAGEICAFPSVSPSTSSPFAHRGASTFWGLEWSEVVWWERGTTQLLEDNLSPLIRSPMWWHSLTSTICWNTSREQSTLQRLCQEPPSLPARPAQSRAGCWVAPCCQEAGTRTQLGAEGDTRMHAQKLSETGARKPP